MKLGISAELSHSSPEDWGKKLSALGCTCAIFPVDYHADISLIDEYVRVARERKLVLGEVGAWCSPLADDEKVRLASVERCVEQLKLADYIGAECCVNITGAPGARWDGAYKENFSQAFYEKIVGSIQHIIDEAKPKRTFYTIEPMPWMVPASPDGYVRLIEDVNRDRFAVHMDLANWMNSYDRFFGQEQFIDEIFQKLGPKIKSCHLKDVALKEPFIFQLQETACGQGSLNLKYYIEKMLMVDPNMAFYLEHLPSEEDYIPSMAYVKGWLQEEGLL